LPADFGLGLGLGLDSEPVKIPVAEY